MAGVANIDTSTLIHVGVELVVVGGLAFWVHRKTSDLQDQVSGLTEKVNKYEEILKRQGELLAQHENALRQVFAVLNGGAPPPQPQPKPQPKQTPRKRSPKRSPPKRKAQTGHSQPKAAGSPARAAPNIGATFSKLAPESIEVPIADDVEDEEGGTNVDDLLAAELAELGGGSAEEGECNADGTCDLKPAAKKK